MKIGILGSGIVGRTLGSGLAAREHDVAMGTRDPKSATASAWVEQAGANVFATSYAEAAAWCEIAVFASTWIYAQDVAEAAGAANLAGKIVIDVSNPVGILPDGSFGMLLPVDEGGGLLLQRWLPAARVVKALNSASVSAMVDPQLPGGSPVTPICGNDADAKQEVSAIVCDLGWEPVDLGGIEFVGFLEALAMVRMRYAMTTGSRTNTIAIVAE
jgi:predicted dinucleotide-binding enzyme